MLAFRAQPCSVTTSNDNDTSEENLFSRRRLPDRRSRRAAEARSCHVRPHAAPHQPPGLRWRRPGWHRRVRAGVRLVRPQVRVAPGSCKPHCRKCAAIVERAAPSHTATRRGEGEKGAESTGWRGATCCPRIAAPVTPKVGRHGSGAVCCAPARRPAARSQPLTCPCLALAASTR